MQITAAMVKELRDRTGAGMMDCKKALADSNGDIEAAIETMRKSGVAKAARKAGRIAAEGVILIRQSHNTNDAILLEINSETDFVAKDENFSEFTDQVAECILKYQPDDVDALMTQKIDNLTVEEARQQLVAKVGENISVRRFKRVMPAGKLGQYLHGKRIGVLVDMDGGDDNLAKDIAMHIAGFYMPPVCIREEDVPEDMIEKEKAVFTAQAEESGKPKDIIEKMIAGKIKKFVQEISLLSQPYIRDPDLTINSLLKNAGANVNAFYRFQLGEGIEKRSDNFADEVLAQAKGE